MQESLTAADNLKVN